ncbi:MAG: asparagine--tRNA ligase, partial [Bacteroidia bacterium]|nr:asparagine--tRNA ligase [Bacteroidia bacterium]
FYGDTAYLSQSGQLYGEAMAFALGKIYTFGPTFRAEKSKTRRHLSEFWMIEPEMVFYDIFQNMDVIENFLRFVVSNVLSNCKAELELVGRDITVLENITKPFPRLTYDEAVRIIKGEQNVNGQNSIQSLEEELTQVQATITTVNAEIAEREAKIKTPGMKKGEIGFNQAKIDKLKQELKDLEEQERNIPGWLDSARNFEYGNDFGGSDETVLTRLFDVPVMVYNWPHAVKAFYLKRDPDNADFARGVDVLAPEGYGEIVGGGERETDVDLLIGKINEHQLPMEAFEWYLDLRRYGSVPHAGFGLGLERLVTWICKLPHVRESIPFPRMYGRLKP